MVSEHHVAWAHTGRLGISGHTGRDLRLVYGIWSQVCVTVLPPDLETYSSCLAQAQLSRELRGEVLCSFPSALARKWVLAGQ